jgi:phosphopantetheinyl transferase
MREHRRSPATTAREAQLDKFNYPQSIYLFIACTARPVTGQPKPTPPSFRHAAFTAASDRCQPPACWGNNSMFDAIHLTECRLVGGECMTLSVGRLDPAATEVSESDCPSLTAEDRQRAERFADPRFALQFTASHVLLYSVLRRDLGPGFSPDQIRRERLGKPFLPGNPVYFSLSRSDVYAAVAICRARPIGIDIETRIDPTTVAEIAHRFLQPREIEECCAFPLSRQLKEFTAFWSVKEAILKASGEGFSRDPREIRLKDNNGIPRAVALPSIYGDPANWECGSTVISDGVPPVYWSSCTSASLVNNPS